MLQNFLVCAGAVVPSAIYLIIGAILRASKVLGDRSVKKFTHVIFVALYPFLMFDNLYGKNLEEHMNAGLIIYAVAFTMFQLIASWFFVCRIEPDNYHRGAMIQALFRSNYVLMGLPIAINLFGMLFCRQNTVLTKRLIQHESIHTQQMREMLFFGFYLWYLGEWIVRIPMKSNAYLNISFEREAYQHMDDEDYLQNRRPFAWIKYLKKRENYH